MPEQKPRWTSREFILPAVLVLVAIANMTGVIGHVSTDSAVQVAEQVSTILAAAWAIVAFIRQQTVLKAEERRTATAKALAEASSPKA